EVEPLLAAEGVRIVRPGDLDPDQRSFLDHYFGRVLSPILTPLAIDPEHPFPHLANRSLCLIASIRPTGASLLPHASLAVVHIPGQVVPRFIALPSRPGSHVFILLEDVIRLHLPALYRGYELNSCHAIRVTRDAEFEVKRGRADDLLTIVEAGLRERRTGSAGPPGWVACPWRCAPRSSTSSSWATTISTRPRASRRSPICSSCTPRWTCRG